jgi:hypothetical protein
VLQHSNAHEKCQKECGDCDLVLFGHLCPKNEKPTCLKILAGGSVRLDPGLDKCYPTISPAPDGFMPQQQQQVLRPFWQHKVMVQSLYPIYSARVNFRFL